MYDQGRSFIGYTSMGDYGFGNTKSEPGNSESDISGGSFNLEYGHYIARDIALGAGLSWNGSSEKDNYSKTTSSSLSFMPMITLNAPTKNCFENFYLQAGMLLDLIKIKPAQPSISTIQPIYASTLGSIIFLESILPLHPRSGMNQKHSKTPIPMQRISNQELNLV
jgi:hypothetical protein